MKTPRLKFERYIPPIMAALIAVVGIVTVVSAIPLSERGLGPARIITPWSMREVSHSGALLVGVFLLYLATQLRRRKRRALQTTMLMLAIATVGHLFKGPDLVDAAIPFVALCLLAYFHESFAAQSDPPSLTRLFRFVPIYLGLVLLYGIVTLSIAHNHLSPSPTLWGVIQTTLRGLIGSPGIYVYDKAYLTRVFQPSLQLFGILGAGFCLFLFFRPIVQRPTHTQTDWERARSLVRTYGWDTLAYFSLRPDKNFFFSSDGQAMIAYAYLGGYALASGDPIGNPNSIKLVIAEFLAMCRRRAWGVAFLATREADKELYKQHNLHTQYLGDEAVIDCQKFNLEGRSIRKVRQSVTRLTKAGYTFELMSSVDVSDRLRDQLVEISEKWRGKAPERGFGMTLGRFIPRDDPACLVAIARDDTQTPRGFFHLVPCFGDKPGYSLDIQRRHPDTPNGLTEYMVAQTAQHLKERGMHRLSMNFAAFARVLNENKDQLTRWQRMQGALIRRFNPWFQIESLYQANKKYFPDFVPRCIYYDKIRHAPRITLLYVEAEAIVRIPIVSKFLMPKPGDRPPIPEIVAISDQHKTPNAP